MINVNVVEDNQCFAFIDHALAQAERYGVRRLLILSGQQNWCYKRAQKLVSIRSAEWLWISDNASLAKNRLESSKAHTLLGQELTYVIFDATQGFDADALAAVSGTLVAGGLLVLLTPQWSDWESQPDKDSLRWSEQDKPIATPHFIKHVKNTLLAHSDCIIWRQNKGLIGQLLTKRMPWHKPDNKPTVQQQAVLQRLLKAPPDYYVLTADRGRGKSSLAGMLITQWQGSGQCWLTGPNKLSAMNVLKWSNHKALFIAPDNLLEQCRQGKNHSVDWLIVDEAAAIPMHLLYEILPFFKRILFTTTVLGYEGTGRGFLLKFCAGLPHWQRLTLSSPVRWADSDPLERTVTDMLLFNAENDLSESGGAVKRVVSLSQNQLSQDLRLLRQFYGLLTSAHYRTTPLDLRRLLDAPNMRFQAAINDSNHIVGALWSVQEGGVTPELAHAIWAGKRRPRGNLVAQSLSAHAGLYDAPMLISARVSRIAIQTVYRRNGIAKRLIVELAEKSAAAGLDYLSVSFGYTPQLWAFWQACGFHIVHIGSQKEASSGCYAAMAIVPFTTKAERLLALAQQRLQTNRRAALLGLLDKSEFSKTNWEALSDMDWLELAGFAFAHRTIDSAHSALQRLLTINHDSEALTFYVQQDWPTAKLAKHLGLSGKKELTKFLRHETARLLFQLDRQKISHLQDWVNTAPVE